MTGNMDVIFMVISLLRHAGGVKSFSGNVLVSWIGWYIFRLYDTRQKEMLMERFYNPESIAIVGLSSKKHNIPRLVLENLIRWGYRGRIHGVNPSSNDRDVDGVRMYPSVADLPETPDLALVLIPARYIPAIVRECGRAGIHRMAIPSGGFNELGERGESLADELVTAARESGVRFVGPNGITLANTVNGLCLPFIPSYPPPQGGLSVITQSGGVGLMLWNLMSDENVGMAKFASIGNKLNMDEVDFLEYFGRDPETKIIGMYLESISRGRELIEVAAKIDKPIIMLKSGTSGAGMKAAMSHTAALSGDDDIIDDNFQEAGIIRINDFEDFISVSKAFSLPPMRGKRIMVMSPAGGFTVMMADLCEENGFTFADPGGEFYSDLQQFSNAGVINFSNPLDMGDIYDARMYAHITHELLHNENVDGAVYVSQWPNMPKGDNVFYDMFHTDLSTEMQGAILSSGKPMAATLFGLSHTLSRIKANMQFPLFNNAEEMIRAMRIQSDFYTSEPADLRAGDPPKGYDRKAIASWIKGKSGDFGEESLELFEACGLNAFSGIVAATADEAAKAAGKIGAPVVMKLVSPDILHKTDAGGVAIDLRDEDSVRKAFDDIMASARAYKKDANIEGVRVVPLAPEGIDMYIGARRDDSFGPVVYFGYGGVYVEIFRDVHNALCPSRGNDVMKKVRNLKTYGILSGTRGSGRSDIEAYVDAILRISHLMAENEIIQEMDCNPVRCFPEGRGVALLDARMRIGE